MTKMQIEIPENVRVVLTEMARSWDECCPKPAPAKWSPADAAVAVVEDRVGIHDFSHLEEQEGNLKKGAPLIMMPAPSVEGDSTPNLEIEVHDDLRDILAEMAAEADEDEPKPSSRWSLEEMALFLLRGSAQETVESASGIATPTLPR
jgi:hypothetical protein